MRAWQFKSVRSRIFRIYLIFRIGLAMQGFGEDAGAAMLPARWREFTTRDKLCCASPDSSGTTGNHNLQPCLGTLILSAPVCPLTDRKRKVERAGLSGGRPGRRTQTEGTGHKQIEGSLETPTIHQH